MTPAALVAIVLAGGESRRFGSDKLTALVGDEPLLDRAVADLPTGAEVIRVGAEVRGGPAAGMVAGLQQALAGPAELLAVLPGDAPLAGRLTRTMVERLATEPGTPGLVAVDRDGRLQPLQLVLRREAAAALIAAAGSGGGVNASARRLVAPLGLIEFPGRAVELFDIDTPEQLLAWQLRQSPAVEQILRSAAGRPRPLVLALDGPSGAGKSTLAAALALRLDAVVIDGDDFYNPVLGATDPEELTLWSDERAAGEVIDWRRLRSEALEPLLAGRPVEFRPYDWDTDDGSLGRRRQLTPAEVIILEGVYSARPELADLIGLSVYVGAEPAVRELRRRARDGDAVDDPRLRAFWDRAEACYFARIRPPESYDVSLKLSSL